MNKHDHPKPLMRHVPGCSEPDQTADQAPGAGTDPLADFVRVFYGRKHAVGAPQSDQSADARDLTPSSKPPVPSPAEHGHTSGSDPEAKPPDKPEASSSKLAAAARHPAASEQSGLRVDSGSEQNLSLQPTPQSPTVTSQPPGSTASPLEDIANENWPMVPAASPPLPPDQSRPDRHGGDSDDLSPVATSTDSKSFRERLARAALPAEQVMQEPQSEERASDSSADHKPPGSAGLDADGTGLLASPRAEPARGSQHLSPAKGTVRSERRERTLRPAAGPPSEPLPLAAAARVRIVDKDARASRWDPNLLTEAGLSALLPSRSRKRMMVAAGAFAACIVVGTTLIIFRSWNNAGATPSQVITPSEIIPRAEQAVIQDEGGRDVDGAVPDWPSPKDGSRIRFDASQSKAPAGLIGPKNIRAVLIRPDGTVVSGEALNVIGVQPAPEQPSRRSDASAAEGAGDSPQTKESVASAASGRAAESVAGTQAAAQSPTSKSAIEIEAGDSLQTAEDVVLAAASEAARDVAETQEGLLQLSLQSDVAAMNEAEGAAQTVDGPVSAAASGAARDVAETEMAPSKRAPQSEAHASTKVLASHKSLDIFAPSEDLVARPKDDWTLVFAAPEASTVSSSDKNARADRIPIPRPRSRPNTVAAPDGGSADSNWGDQ